jgi:hypothetical protein
MDGVSGGSLAWTFTQTGASVVGPLGLDGSACFSTGSAQANVAGSAVTGTVTFGVGGTLTFQGTVAGDQFTGTYAITAGPCAGDTGQLEAMRSPAPPPPRIALVHGLEVLVLPPATPTDVLLAHLDTDGTLDLVASIGTPAPSGEVRTYRGLGNGGFDFLAEYEAGDGPSAVAGGDLDGNTTFDVVLSDSVLATAGLVRYLGVGDGSLHDPLGRAAGTNPIDVAVADFDGDGVLDVVLADGGSHHLHPFQGGAGGVPTGRPAVDTTVALQEVHAALLDGDDRADVVAACLDTVRVFHGIASPDLLSPTPAQVLALDPPHTAPVVALGDLTMDGVADLVVAAQGGGNSGVFLFRGVGDGTFEPDPTPGPGSTDGTLFRLPHVAALAVADLDGDGPLDIVAASPAGLLTIAFRDAGTAFTFLSVVPPHPSMPTALSIGDLNGDARPDLVVLEATQGGVAVYLNEEP